MHPTAVLFNGGVFKSPLLAERTLATLNGWLTAEGAAAGAAARRRRPRPRGRARRGLLRLRAARPRRAHPRRHGVRVLRRRRIVDAGGARHRAAGAGAVRRAVRHGGGHRGRAAGARARPGGRRAGALPLLRLVGAARGRASARCSTPGRPTSCRSSTRSRPRCRPRAAAPGDVVPVRLHARVTEAGTLELEAVPRSGDERWKVEFDVRGERQDAQAA